MTDFERDDEGELRRLLGDVQALRDEVKREGAALLDEWGASATGPGARARAFNLAHWVALRGCDLTALQHRLSAFGLCSLGRSESAVMPALDALVATLRRLCGERPNPYPGLAAARSGANELEAETNAIFGPRRDGAPDTRIMATLPREAAADPRLVENLVAAGMDCARINCAHDDVEAWAAMIDNVRAAENALGVECRVLMDIAGPRCRITGVDAEPKCRLMRGDRALIVRKLAARKGEGLPRFTISFPEILGQLEAGAVVFVDDGKARARVVRCGPGEAEIEIYAAREKGVRLKADKGVEFPATELDLPPLTTKDFRDLDFVAAHADLVGFSSAQRPADVELLQDHLAARRRGQPPQALVLEIETPLAMRNLPRLLLESLPHNPTAVRIARGDLAVDGGLARLCEMQGEIRGLCEAAGAPVVWATPALDPFVRAGAASRSAMTGAAARGAECVMLDKGPHLAEGIAFLKDALGRRDRHHTEKCARHARLGDWSRG